jgi:amino acid transporter
MLINAMVGAGLLAAPARVFGLVGDWGFLVLAAAGAIIAPLVLCFADLGSRFQGTGGPYLYARAALPGWVAFSVGWLIWASQGLAVATLCNLLIDYLSGSAPWVSQDGPRAAIIVILGLGFTAIVLAGIGPSTRVGNVLAGIKVAFVVGFALAAAAFIRPENLAAASPPPAPLDFAQALLVYLFAYTGFERASILAGEARDPQRDVPIALIASVAGVTLLYAAVLAACQGVLGDPSATDRPLAEVGALLFGAPGQALITAGALVVILGTLLNIVISMPRLILALAENGQLPVRLGAVNARWRTPHWAILLSSVVAFGAALSSDLLGSLTISTAARVGAYILCCVALWRLAGRTDAPAPLFDLPARRSIAAITGMIFLAVLIFGASREFLPLAGVLAAGLVLLWVSRRAMPAPGPQSRS